MLRWHFHCNGYALAIQGPNAFELAGGPLPPFNSALQKLMGQLLLLE